MIRKEESPFVGEGACVSMSEAADAQIAGFGARKSGFRGKMPCCTVTQPGCRLSRECTDL